MSVLSDMLYDRTQKKLHKIQKKFAGLKFCRTFAIPNSSGGGEMVDTLL